MKSFKDYLQEISLKTKANAYKKMKQTAREYKKDSYYGPHDEKLANKRAVNMAKSIRKSHPKGKDVVKGIDKKTSSGGYDYGRDDRKDPLVNKQRYNWSYPHGRGNNELRKEFIKKSLKSS